MGWILASSLMFHTGGRVVAGRKACLITTTSNEFPSVINADVNEV
jgi:hypothetical protein